MKPTPTINARLRFRLSGFGTLSEGLDYAARGETGCNFFSARGELQQVLPYRDLRARAGDLAARLAGLDFARGSRAAIIAETSPEFLEFFFACQYAGLIPVPLPLCVNFGGREAYEERLRGMLSTAQARVAVASEELIGTLRSAATGSGVNLVGTLDELRELPTNGVATRPLGADEPCYIQYSSGSTSVPRGVLVTQRAVADNAAAIAEHGLRLTGADRCVSWLPLYHDMGLVGFMLVPLLSQVTVDYLATRDFARRPLMWPSLISRNRGTLSYSPTFGYDLCSRRVSEGRLATPDLDLSSWRTAGIGGDMIQPHVLERFAGAFAACRFDPKAFLPSYGMAEAVLAISFSPRNRGMLTDSVDRGRMADEGRAVPADPKSGDSRRFVLCGRPLAGHVAEIRGEDGEILPDRMIGRIFVKGPSLMAGYYGNPEETARVLSPDGWLDTGDLGYSLEGALVITGRAKDLIIIAGRNIWPQDLEWSVEESLDLRRGDTCAFSIEGPEGQEQVVMLAVARQTETAEREAMRQGAQSLLQRAHGIEAKVVLVAPRVIPQTSSGKIARARAKAAYLAGHYQESGADAARPR
jgi:fatty-acyl-CoA synthase